MMLRVRLFDIEHILCVVLLCVEHICEGLYDIEHMLCVRLFRVEHV